MDTSEQSIKMCEKAEEIQSGHKWQDGDYTNRGLAYYSGRGNWNVGVDSIEECVWLPRQDQLQEMVIGKYRYEPIASLLIDFEHWRDTYGHNELTSMEQLWLAFVMKEKYQKVWDGNGWKEKRQVVRNRA